MKRANFFIAVLLAVVVAACSRPIAPFSSAHFDQSVSQQSRYPLAAEPSLVGTYSGRSKSGGGATSMTTSLSTGSGSIPSRERRHWLETMTTSPRSRNTSRHWPSRRRTGVPRHPWSWCGSWNRSMNPVQASISTKAAHESLSGSLNGCLDPSASLIASPSSWPRMRQRGNKPGSSSKPTPLRGAG